VKVGETYTLKDDLKVFCCGVTLRIGELVTVLDNQTPNRVRVKRTDGSIHKVKKSTLERRIEETGGR